MYNEQGCTKPQVVTFGLTVVLCLLYGDLILKIFHCIEFDALDVWYLHNIKDFENRTLAFGRCPKCKKQVAVLSETHIISKKEFINVFTSDKALNVIKNERKRVVYSALELKNIDKSTVGFKYGLNKERRNKKNKVSSIKQYSCDFFGNKHLVKKFTVNN